VFGRQSFAREYLMDWYPRAFWQTPLVARLDRHLAWVWILGQAFMAAAAGVVVAYGDANAALYVMCNYVLQLLPLAASVAATAGYPRVLKARWGYDPLDVATGFPPNERGSAACLAAVAEAAAAAAADAEAAGTAGRDAGGDIGTGRRLGSRHALLGSWRQLAGWQAGGSDSASAADDNGGSSIPDSNVHGRAAAAAAASG
jgi:hypothetical protein